MQLAAVLANRTLAERVIIRRHRLHARDRRRTVGLGLCGTHVGRNLQVVQRRGVVAGMAHAGTHVRHLRPQALGECALAVVEVPVERSRSSPAPARSRAPGCGCRKMKHQQPGQRLGDAEFLGLLDAV